MRSILRRFTFIGLLLLAVAVPAQAGFLDKVKGLGSSSQETSAAPNGSAEDALKAGSSLVYGITLATDQGVKAVEIVIDAYPPEKVAKIKELAAKYNELKANRKDKNIDAEAVKVATQIGQEMAALQADWQSYQKEKAEKIGGANRRLALMLVYDGLASTQLPPTINNLNAAIKSVKADPMKAAMLTGMTGIVDILLVISDNIPKQVESFTTVRSITKQVAQAEKFTLPPDPSPDDVKDPDKWDVNFKEDNEG